MKTVVKNYSNKKCPDSFFGQIKNVCSQWKWITINKQRTALLEKEKSIELIDETDKMKQENPNLIIILESPHVKEFDSTGNPICPANGTSGKNLYKHLCDILNSNGKYKNSSINLNNFLKSNAAKTINVFIVNSIQKQCSLGIKPINHIIKESNWIDEWFSSNNDFIKRCNEFPDYFFVNLCTLGIYVPMKEIVKKELYGTIQNIGTLYCEGPHPSTWERLKKIEFK